MMQPTKATIVQALATNPRAVEKAIVMLYDWQTEDEQSTRNAKIGSYMARWIKSGRQLTGSYVSQARQIALYYAGTQLLAAAKVKAARRAQAA